MARAVTAASQVCQSDLHEDKRSKQTGHQDETVHFPLMLAKNILFWGSISLSIYALYALASAL
ncbi:hypothetical protein OA90_15510 [Labrenzia sp. OB1]|nr:hypothetical protein OA90_15510 [Labrenzia sp. OB1]